MDVRRSEPESLADEAERLKAHWHAPAPEPPPARTRIGWLAVGLVICAELALAGIAAGNASSVDPDDPGWADIAFFLSPLFASAAALMIGLVLVVVAWRRLADLTVRRAARAMVVGMIGGPVVYLGILIALASAPDTTGSGRVLAAVTFVLPVVCGIVTTLLPELVHRLRASSV